MRVSKSSDHWCAFGTMSNFEKCNLRSGHFMRPGHVTFEVIGSSFFSEMCQIVGGTAVANLAALRVAVFSLSGKNRTGGPVGARVNNPVQSLELTDFTDFVTWKRKKNRACGAKNTLANERDCFTYIKPEFSVKLYQYPLRWSLYPNWLFSG